MFNSSILLNPMLHTRLSNDWEPNKQEDKHWLKILKLHLINTSNKNEFQAHKKVDETKPKEIMVKSHIPDREWEAVEFLRVWIHYKQLNISNWQKCITKTIANFFP